MPFCKECGMKMGDDTKFCPECGTPNVNRVAQIKAEREAEGRGSDQTMVRAGPVYATASLENLPAGHVIDDRYEIKRKLGQGGFGAVYLAHDRKMETDKALKVIPESVVNDEEAMENLRQEAKTMINLNHPNIVRVYDFHDAGPVKYIDMEYVDGQSLTRLKLGKPEKKLSEEEAGGYALQIAEGLAYAHSRRVVHKDIKPQNVMVGKDGAVKVMDFGIAETVRSSVSRIDHGSSSGTLAYMAPEQIRGENIGKEADIYSFGAMLYELLSGHPPFHQGDIRYQVLNKEPQKIRGISEPTNRLLQRCLAKDYAKRFRGFNEVSVALKGDAALGTGKRQHLLHRRSWVLFSLIRTTLAPIVSTLLAWQVPPMLVWGFPHIASGLLLEVATSGLLTIAPCFTVIGLLQEGLFRLVNRLSKQRHSNKLYVGMAVAIPSFVIGVVALLCTTTWHDEVSVTTADFLTAILVVVPAWVGTAFLFCPINSLESRRLVSLGGHGRPTPPSTKVKTLCLVYGLVVALIVLPLPFRDHWVAGARSLKKLQKAELMMSICRYDLALRLVDEAMMESPKNPEVHLVKGKALLHCGKVFEAENAFKTAIMIHEKYTSRTGDTYLDVAMETMAAGGGDKDCVEDLMNRARIYKPELAPSITEKLLAMAYGALDSVPEIGSELFGVIDCAMKYCDPSAVEAKKHEVCQRLMAHARARQAARLYKSVIHIGEYLNRFDACKAREVSAILLDVYYTIVDGGLTDVCRPDRLAASLERMAPALKNDPKFVYYSVVKAQKPQARKAKFLREFLKENPAQPFSPDVCWRLINVSVFALEFRRATEFVEFFKSNYPTSILLPKVLGKGKELAELMGS